MNVSGIATEIYTELGSPADISFSSIQYWLSGNLGNLNNLINTSFAFIDSGDYAPILSGIEKDIYKKTYYVYYYDDKLRSNLGAASIDSVIQVDVFGNSVRKLNRNELSKTYLQIKKEEVQSLKDMVAIYKDNNSSPLQVAGDDTTVISSVTYTYNRLNYPRGLY